MMFYMRGKKDWHIEPREVHEIFKKMVKKEELPS
jgi:hypothetical protein